MQSVTNVNLLKNENRGINRMSKVIGIDLGTTNSCVSVVENQTPVIIPCSTGGQTTPSVVAFAKNGERMVGAQARRQAVTNPDRTISSVKRHMGTDWEIRIDGLSMNRQAQHCLMGWITESRRKLWYMTWEAGRLMCQSSRSEKVS